MPVVIATFAKAEPYQTSLQKCHCAYRKHDFESKNFEGEIVVADQDMINKENYILSMLKCVWLAKTILKGLIKWTERRSLHFPLVNIQKLKDATFLNLQNGQLESKCGHKRQDKTTNNEYNQSVHEI